MGIQIKIETLDAQKVADNFQRMAATIERVKSKYLEEIGNEILRLGTFEVPHDQGLLQSSGSVKPAVDAMEVGYNKVYAARLHEHPEYNFQKGRKGKYLEDPIKNNLAVFKEYYGKMVKVAIESGSK